MLVALATVSVAISSPVKVMRDSEVLMLSGSDFFHTWGAACPNDCNP